MLPLVILGVLAATAAPVVSAPSLDAALAQAQAEQKLVAAYFGGASCGACVVLEREVLDTPDGARAFAGAVFVELDIDERDEDAAIKRAERRYAVLSFPTVVVLRPDGTEVDRVTGYRGKEHFIAAVKDPLAGVDSLRQLLDRRGAATSDADRARLDLQIGVKQLQRGDDAGGCDTLLRAAALDGDGAARVAPDALMALAQHAHARADQPGADPLLRAMAYGLYREVLARFPRERAATSAAFNYARLLKRLGHDEHALAMLAKRAQDTRAFADIANLVHFAASSGVGRDEAQAALRTPPHDLRMEFPSNQAAWRELQERLAAP